MKIQQKGFTLIELLVVVAIIGILSSVVLASLNGARQRGRDAKRIADIKQLQLALELFYDSNRVYPTSIGTTASSVLVSNGYISVIPTDPSTGASYHYSGLKGVGVDTCLSYHLVATLEAPTSVVLSNTPQAVAGTHCTSPSASATDISGVGKFDAKP